MCALFMTSLSFHLHVDIYVDHVLKDHLRMP